MSKKTHTTKEVFEVLWCNIRDLMVITSSKEAKAFRLKNIN